MQTAAIMGNLRQESGYKTDDTPSGLGIAQWLGARRERLVNLGRYEELGTQLNYLVYELRMVETRAHEALLGAVSLEAGTILFQNLYERCNPEYCNQEKRIDYAKDVLNRYN